MAVASAAVSAPGAVTAEAPGPGAADEALSKVPGIRDRSGSAPLRRVFEKADPTADDAWRSEALGAAADRQLKKIGAAFEDREALPDEILDTVLAPGFSTGTGFRPVLEPVFSDGSLTVLRPTGDIRPAPGPRTGRDGFRDALADLLSPFGNDVAHPGRAKFKTLRVEPGSRNDGGTDALLETTVYFESAGTRADGTALGQTATFECRWESGDDPEHPRLAALDLVRFEEVVQERPPHGGPVRPLFDDATAAVLGGDPGFREQLVHGADHWYANLDVSFGIHQGNQGLAIGDADGDGDDDLFVCQPAGLPSKLFLRRPDGTLRDATVEAGLDWLDNARSALFVDVDNDGDQDLALTLGYSLTLHENDGAGRFTLRVAIDIHSWPTSIAAADHDNDGDLDFFVCGYNPRGETAPGDIFANPVPYHDANNGARNFFLDNLGGFDFADITERTGLNANNRRFTFAASWEDYDDDGDQDLYVANDFGRNNLYRNELVPSGEARFTDVAAEAGVEDIAAGMSVDWGDHDRDARMDLHVGNMFSSAGHRVTSQAQFMAASDEATRSSLQRHARGNSLFANTGDGTFRDVSIDAGITMGRWAWSSRFVDFNSDGWDDLHVANGFFTTEDTGDL